MYPPKLRSSASCYRHFSFKLAWTEIELQSSTNTVHKYTWILMGGLLYSQFQETLSNSANSYLPNWCYYGRNRCWKFLLMYKGDREEVVYARWKVRWFHTRQRAQPAVEIRFLILWDRGGQNMPDFPWLRWAVTRSSWRPPDISMSGMLYEGWFACV